MLEGPRRESESVSVAVWGYSFFDIVHGICTSLSPGRCLLGGGAFDLEMAAFMRLGAGVYVFQGI